MTATAVIARPYARAAFEWAREHDKVEAWAEALGFLEAVVSDADLSALLADPRHGRAEKTQALLDIAADRLDTEQQSFLRLLGENGRLAAIAAVSQAFRELRSSSERKIQARATSFRKLTQAQLKTLTQALTDRLQCEVELEQDVDESLLGGVVLRAGDLVIDGSVRGQLQRLASQLSR
ncbi:MAG: F0F1 ATP synthase subunit delta [Thioalkalivibrionaceae bacterium]